MNYSRDLHKIVWNRCFQWDIQKVKIWNFKLKNLGSILEICVKVTTIQFRLKLWSSGLYQNHTDRFQAYNHNQTFSFTILVRSLKTWIASSGSVFIKKKFIFSKFLSDSELSISRTNDFDSPKKNWNFLLLESNSFMIVFCPMLITRSGNSCIRIVFIFFLYRVVYFFSCQFVFWCFLKINIFFLQLMQF